MDPLVKSATLREIKRSDVTQIQKKWLRENKNPNIREFVGQGFLTLKNIIEEEGPLTNAKVKILDDDYEITVYIKTRDYSGINRKKWRIHGQRAIRYDTGKTFNSVASGITKGFNSVAAAGFGLYQMIKEPFSRCQNAGELKSILIAI